MDSDDSRLTSAEVSEEVSRLRAFAQRAHDYGDSVLWMVLHSAAESVADGLEMQEEVWADAQ